MRPLGKRMTSSAAPATAVTVRIRANPRSLYSLRVPFLLHCEYWVFIGTLGGRNRRVPRHFEAA